MEWVNVRDSLPESMQEVVGYWGEDDGEGGVVPYYTILTYFKKGDFMMHGENKDITDGRERLLDSITNPNNEMSAPKDGFYFYASEEIGLMRHSDIITHWALLKQPSK